MKRHFRSGAVTKWYKMAVAHYKILAADSMTTKRSTDQVFSTVRSDKSYRDNFLLTAVKESSGTNKCKYIPLYRQSVWQYLASNMLGYLISFHNCKEFFSVRSHYRTSSSEKRKRYRILHSNQVIKENMY